MERIFKEANLAIGYLEEINTDLSKLIIKWVEEEIKPCIREDGDEFETLFCLHSIHAKASAISSFLKKNTEWSWVEFDPMVIITKKLIVEKEKELAFFYKNEITKQARKLNKKK